MKYPITPSNLLSETDTDLAVENMMTIAQGEVGTILSINPPENIKLITPNTPDESVYQPLTEPISPFVFSKAIPSVHQRTIERRRSNQSPLPPSYMGGVGPFGIMGHKSQTA